MRCIRKQVPRSASQMVTVVVVADVSVAITQSRQRCAFRRRRICGTHSTPILRSHRNLIQYSTRKQTQTDDDALLIRSHETIYTIHLFCALFYISFDSMAIVSACVLPSAFRRFRLSVRVVCDKYGAQTRASYLIFCISTWSVAVDAACRSIGELTGSLSTLQWQAILFRYSNVFIFSMCDSMHKHIYCIVSVGVSWSTNLTIFDGKEGKEKKKVGINESETENQIVSVSIDPLKTYKHTRSELCFFFWFFRVVLGKSESFAHLLLHQKLDNTKILHQFMGTVEISIISFQLQFFPRNLFAH